MYMLEDAPPIFFPLEPFQPTKPGPRPLVGTETPAPAPAVAPVAMVKATTPAGDHSPSSVVADVTATLEALRGSIASLLAE